MSLVHPTTPLPQRRPLASAVGVVLLCILLGAVGGLVTAPAIENWYVTLEKPWFTPPSWLFVPVWALLYTLQGLVAWLLWRSGVHRRPVRVALVLFGIQFALNMAWSPAFFGLRSPLAGIAVIVPLIAAIAATMEASWYVDRRATVLLVPYLFWVGFAMVLNLVIFSLN